MPHHRVTLTVAAVAVAASLTACTSNTTITTTPDTSHATRSAAKTAAKVAHVGDTITMKTTGGMFRLTLVKTDPNPRVNNSQIDTPDPGDRFYAVQLRIINDTTQADQGDPYNDVTVQDSKGQSYQTTIIASGIKDGPLFPATVNLTAGSTALGWLVLNVAKTATITHVQFTSEAGLGDTAQWAVP